jgi:ribosomal protein S18 acetylase RimI-like enzyme
VRRIVVRLGTESDLEKATVGGRHGEYRQELADVLRRERARLLVAEVDGAVVGRITLECADDDAELFGLVVDARRRRRGIGTTLLNAAEAEACRLGCRLVHLTVGKANDGALVLYERRGYRVAGDGESHGLASPTGRVIPEREPVWKMTKALTTPLATAD